MSELREALEAAVTSHEEPAAVVDSAPVAESAPEPVESSPAESAAPAKEPEAPAEKPEAEPEGQKTETAPAEPAKKEHRIDRAPVSWKKEAKGEWAAVPLHIRQEVHKREMEINKVLNETAQVREQAQQFQQTVSPYMARIQSAGISPMQAIGELLKADYVLATAPREQRADFLAKLLFDYDVDVVALDKAIVARMGGQAQQPAQQGFDPNQINQLVQQQLQQALAPIYQERQQKELAQQQQVTQTVEQMALDPKYPYFDEVREDMADLMELNFRRGIPITLEQAYNKAVLMNDSIAAQSQRQTTMTQANQQHLQAQRAKVAAASVTGAPASGGSQQFAGDGSLRGAIEAAFSGARV